MLTPDNLEKLLTQAGYTGFTITRLTRRAFLSCKKLQTDIVTITHPDSFELTAISRSLNQANINHDIDAINLRLIVDLSQVD